jgi:hypothetical protein
MMADRSACPNRLSIPDRAPVAARSLRWHCHIRVSGIHSRFATSPDHRDRGGGMDSALVDGTHRIPGLCPPDVRRIHPWAVLGAPRHHRCSEPSSGLRSWAATARLAESDRAPTVHRRRDLGGVLDPLPDSSADPMVVVALSTARGRLGKTEHSKND